MSIYTIVNLALLERAKKGDKNAEEQLVNQNLGLVHSAVKRLIYPPYEYEDLFQHGCIGLIKAIRSFDNTKANMLSTYAVPVIAGEIKKVLRDESAIKISRHLKEVNLRTIKAIGLFRTKEGYEPSVKQIYEITGDSEDEIILASDACVIPLSFDSPLDAENDATLGELLGEDKTEELTESINIKQAIKELPADDRQLIALRFIRGKTQSETAKLLKQTQVQISRKEKKILSILKDKLTG